MDFLTHEADHTDAPPDPDLAEVCNYLEALDFARSELADPNGLPLSTRLLGEMHARLMQGVRGATKQPGEVRRSQNWIGGTRPGNASFIPPPPEALPALLADLEQYVHQDDDLPPLVRAGLLHVQFETIHPYLDGNSRLGRLLITLLLEHWGLLSQPLLYLSLHLKRHRQVYYSHLDAVRERGDWEGWTDFFLEGVTAIAEEAIASIRELFLQISRDRTKAQASATSSLAAARLFEMLPLHPIISVAFVTRALSVSKPTAARAIHALEEAGILQEATGQKRDRSWSYTRYLELLRAES